MPPQGAVVWGKGAIVRSVRLILWGSLLAGAMLVVGAGQSSAWTNSCTNEPKLTSGGEDYGIDVGPGDVFVGVDTEAGRLGSAEPALGVCVNDEVVGVTTTTSSGAYVWVNHCSGGSCSPVLKDTGLKPSGPTTVNILPTTTVDPGYDLYVDGTNLMP